MKKVSFFVFVFLMFFCFVSCSSDSYELSSLREEYDRLESEYNELENLYQTYKDDSESYTSTMVDEYETSLYGKDLEIKYYEDMCKKLGLLNYDEALGAHYAYVETGTKIYHYNYYCSATNTSRLKAKNIHDLDIDYEIKLVDIGEESSKKETSSAEDNNSKTDKWSECPVCQKDDIYILDPSTKTYHNRYADMPFTKDYKTVSFPYTYATEEKAKESGFSPCKECLSEK